MNPVPFIIAAFAVSFTLTGALLFISWRQMVAAESAVPPK